MPLRLGDSLFLGIFLQNLWAILFGVYAKGSDSHFGITKKFILDFFHILGHYWANGWAGCKEEFHHIHLPFKILVRNGFLVLIRKRKVRDFHFFFLLYYEC